METITLRGAYQNFEREKLPRYRVHPDIPDSTSPVEQNHKDRCDIDYIIRQYDKTGLITHVNRAVAEYGDYTEVNEYQEAMNIVLKAQQDFMGIPSDIRAKFQNDPGKFFEFATNPENFDEMVELGLAVKPETQPPVQIDEPDNGDDTGADCD